MQDIENVYKENAQIVYKYILSLTGNKELAEEITQDTFVVAVKDINKFKGNCKISVWLCQIAKYIWYKQIRKNKVKVVAIEDTNEEIISLENIEDAICDKQEKIDLFKKLQKLDDKTREVMYLKLEGDLNFMEIAEILGKTPNWARVTFYRGKQKLREEFNNEK